MIRFRVVSVGGQPSTQEIVAEFDETGGTIGRAATNQLVLPDQERQISRQHATVVFRGGRYVIVDQGTAIPVYVNGRAIGSGKESAIGDGDELRIGYYTLQVSMSPGKASAPAFERPASVPPEIAPAAGRGKPVDDPLAIFEGGFPRASDPFADAPKRAPGLSSGAVAAPAQQGPGSSDSLPLDGPQIPEDFDPFADKYASKPLYGDDALSKPHVEFNLGVSPQSEVQGIDSLFGLAPGDRAEILANGGPLGVPVSESNVLPGADPFVALGVPSSPERPSERDDVPEIHGSFQPPTAKPEARAPRGSPAPIPRLEERIGPVVGGKGVAPAEAGLTEEALARAFLAGLGAAQLQLPNGLTPEFMQLVGMLMREAVQGTLDLLLARAMTKRDLRAVVTMMAEHDNNPLKFSPNVDVALAHLFSPQDPGFLPPVEAMRDAYDDLRSHTFGFMAGLRAALAEVLARFNPEHLERRLTEKTVLDSLLLMNRKAKLWDLYREKYQALSEEAEEDFHALFGREFLRVYEEQVARLREK